jgi:hypothetical protein
MLTEEKWDEIGAWLERAPDNNCERFQHLL